MKNAIAENKISLDRLNNKLKSATESIINRNICKNYSNAM